MRWGRHGLECLVDGGERLVAHVAAGGTVGEEGEVERVVHACPEAA